MCDYSLHVPARNRRNARVGDHLELRNWGGFVDARFGRVTCLKPGTEVVFERRQVLRDCRSFVECDGGERILVHDILPCEARAAALPGGYRGRPVDGFEFANGLQCPLAALERGVRLRVLQLPAKKTRKAKKLAAKELELVNAH